MPCARGLICLLACALALPILAGAYHITLTDYLDHRWTREFVTYPFATERGQCVAESVTLNGPNGPQPVQLTNIVYWPDTRFVKTATLAFVVDELAPLTTHDYTVTYAPQGAVKQPAGDLTVTPGAGRCDGVTSRFGARLLTSEQTYDPPVDAATVPGPILALRLADGTWFGGSRLYGATKIAGYTARVTDAGPVLFRVECRYRYADGNTNTITMLLTAGDTRLRLRTDVADERPDAGWDILLTGLPPLALQFMPQQVIMQPDTHLINGWKEREIAKYAPGVVTRLSPWGTWTNEFTQTAFYLAFLDTRPAPPADDPGTPSEKVNYDKTPDARELAIMRQDAGAWVTPPAPNTAYRDQVAGLPLMKDADGTLYLRVNTKAGARKWTIGENASYRAKLPHLATRSNVMPDDIDDLNTVKDMVLSWPASPRKQPILFLDAAEMAAAGTRNPTALRQLQNVVALRADLAAYGFFDTMRHSGEVITRYDALIDSELVTAQERPVLRAQMAYLAYRLASPANWSTERGYNSGNANMTVAHLLNQGLAACALADHPMAKTWGAKPLAAMDGWLNTLDAAGNWPESSGYARVSVSKFIFFAIAAHRAGLFPYLQDPRFKRMAMYYERTLTPPDPLCVMAGTAQHPRVSPPYGRGGNANSLGLGGLVAKAIATIDPPFSRALQWSFLATNCSTMLGESMAGYDQLITDPTLPAERPDWHSEILPSIGALYRDGVGTPEENYLLLVTKNATNPDGEIWPSEVGNVAIWFARGVPITRHFPAYPYENYHGLLNNRLMLATNWAPGQNAIAGYTTNEAILGSALLPRLNYLHERYEWLSPWSMFAAPPKSVPAFPGVARPGVLPAAGQPPVTWQRQAAWVHDDTPGGVQYLVLRDTITGGQPTQWQFWTVSQRLETPGAAPTEADADADAPAATPSGKAVALHGDRFTAIGQFGVDLDYYIAAPTDTPRHTLRYSARSEVSGVVAAFMCEQDLLHLQLAGDGSYFVALFPRKHDEPAPKFTTLGNGSVIKVQGTFGTDYLYLAAADGAATAEAASFTGTSASVQDRPQKMILTLGAAGSVACRTYGLTAPAPASARLTAEAIAVEVNAHAAPVTVTLQTPGRWALPKDAKGATLRQAARQGWELTLPAGIIACTLVKAP